MKNNQKKNWNRNRNRNQSKNRQDNDGPREKSKKGASGPFSPSFLDFYRSILIPEQMTEEEFNSMLNLYRHQLPPVFRLSQLAPDHDRLETELTTLFKEIQAKTSVDEKNDSSKSGFSYEEYKNFPSKYGRVFKVIAEKEQIRKLPEFQKFNSWLRFNTDIGNCHRQEFVSMIPPIFMDIKPNSSVLDTCAAPGSKTAQIMEMLSSEINIIPNPDQKENESQFGFVVANDSNSKRCHDLTHQLQRIGTHNVIITCQNGSKCEFGFDQFDRVLCDVPCTGDGTMRKNSEVGPTWNIFSSLNLHEVQKNILLRGLELLKKDGICVYSTCSMNPIEDEAVVSEVITSLGAEKVEIVDCSALYPDLKRHPGLTKWPSIVEAYIRDKKAKNSGKYESPNSEQKDESKEEENKDDGNADKGEDGDNDNSNTTENPVIHDNIENEIIEKGIHTEAKCEGIERCMRFYPQDHDSGGFFVCVLRKIGDFERKTEPKPAKELKEAAFHPLTKVSQQSLNDIYRMYGIHKPSEEANSSDEIKVNENQFFVRDEVKVNKVYYMSQPIADLINKYGSESLHTVSAGIQVFNFKSYSKDSPFVPYVAQEGIKVAFQMATQRKYALTPAEMKMLLESGPDGLKISQFDTERQKIFDNKPRTVAIFYIENTKFMYSGHLAKFSIKIYLKKDLLQLELKQLTAQFPELADGEEEKNE
ncbi:hypothetical protein M9Y10_042006 [Tritrichomonas musculus]|uniref:SAM-dependent MTase RsmB/NOP-type domain-containing protein n=1 Tax=Tritrichomonas musculus TaxID=1915356 RepID=A0ABR2K6K4_9EUKA